MDVSASHRNEARSVLLMDGLGSLMLPPVVCLPERGDPSTNRCFIPSADGGDLWQDARVISAMLCTASVLTFRGMHFLYVSTPLVSAFELNGSGTE